MPRLKLVDDYRQAWKWFSVQAIALLSVLPSVWLSLPEEWRDAVPDGWKIAGCLLVGAAGIYGRIVDQRKPPAPEMAVWSPEP